MENQKGNPRQQLNSLRIIHMALFTGIVLFGTMSIFITVDGPIEYAVNDENMVFVALATFFSLSGLISSMLIFKSKLKLDMKKPILIEKLQSYTSSTIIKLALLEGPILFVLVCNFFGANYIFFGLGAVLIIVFLLNAPTKNKVIMDLELNREEIKMLEA